MACGSLALTPLSLDYCNGIGNIMISYMIGDVCFY